MEELVRQYGIPVAVALLIGYLSRYTEPQSRVVWWYPAALRFQAPFTDQAGAQQTVTIWTHAVTIQNVGWRAARNVEIIHRFRPQHFQFQPVLNFTEAVTPTGEHVIAIASLARREFATLQILGVATAPPELISVKSADGPSTRVATQQQFTVTKPRRYIFYGLLAVGFVTTVYWGLRVAATASRLLGHLLRQ